MTFFEPIVVPGGGVEMLGLVRPRSCWASQYCQLFKNAWDLNGEGVVFHECEKVLPDRGIDVR